MPPEILAPDETPTGCLATLHFLYLVPSWKLGFFPSIKPSNKSSAVHCPSVYESPGLEAISLFKWSLLWVEAHSVSWGPHGRRGHGRKSTWCQCRPSVVVSQPFHCLFLLWPSHFCSVILKASGLVEVDPWRNVNRNRPFDMCVSYPVNASTFLSADTGFWFITLNTKSRNCELKTTPEKSL